MSTKPPDLGPAGSGELDNPAEPAGLGPGSSGTLDTNIPIAPPREPQPVAGGIPQDLGIGGARAEPETERRIQQEDPDRWSHEERRSPEHHYGASHPDNPYGGSTRH